MTRGIIREGSIAGVLGATSVAVWFFIIDVALRHPFQTPIRLGRGFFTLFGQTTTGHVELLVLISYTVFHYLAFIIVGLVVAAIADLAERQPTVMAGALILFVVFEVGFYGLTSTFSGIPVIGTLAWYNVAVGNLIAALTMGAYMRRVHPKLAGKLVYALEGKE